MLPSLTFPSAGTLPATSIIAPSAPNAIPKTFFTLTASFRKIAESAKAISGMLVVIIDASTGDAKLTPKIKHP